MTPEQQTKDQAAALSNLIANTDFKGDGVVDVMTKVTGSILCRAEELGLNINAEPFASLSNRSFTSYAVPDDYKSISWVTHVYNFCQLEDILQSSGRTEMTKLFNDFEYGVSYNPDTGVREYSFEGKVICDCTGTPTLQDMRNLGRDDFEN